jgi:oligopeptide/dipeptide ABC transporter ATP-binding protein
MSEPFLDIRDLHLWMRSFEGEAHVLQGVSLQVRHGEVWGIVGETGCGKSLTGLSVSRLVPSPPARYGAGQILFDGQDLLQLTETQMRALRGSRIGMIFQDPTTNLNPLFRISEQLVDVALAAASWRPELLGLPAGAGLAEKRRAARRLALEMLDRVRIPDAAHRLDDFPHQFSGGMRQRVLIAMALMGRPQLLIADEPTTALDVSVQAQVLALLGEMVRDFRMTVLLITHNLGVVAQTCSHVAVMYAGAIVERGPVSQVLRSPVHPYTRALLAAIPRRDMARGELQGIPGAVPDLIHPPAGCRFAPRCSHAKDACRSHPPVLSPVSLTAGTSAEHQAACWCPQERAC